MKTWVLIMLVLNTVAFFFTILNLASKYTFYDAGAAERYYFDIYDSQILRCTTSSRDGHEYCEISHQPKEPTQ